METDYPDSTFESLISVTGKKPIFLRTPTVGKDMPDKYRICKLKQTRMNGIFFFVLLPYVAIISLIFGSIYRYRFHGYKVSSLSSQLLENNLLFFGSRPFHWGIITLFFGHLIAFLIPAAVLAWNGKPLRLYILEISAFAFGIISFTGLTSSYYQAHTELREFVL